MHCVLCVRCGLIIVRGQRKNFNEMPYLMLCRYWVSNDPFYCIYHSRDSQCFSLGLTTPKIALSREFLVPRAHMSQCPKRHLDRFSHFFTVHQSQCDQHTDCVTSVVAGRIYANNSNNNKWSKNFNERPHGRVRIFNGDNLMWHGPVCSIVVSCHAVIDDWMTPLAADSQWTTPSNWPFP